MAQQSTHKQEIFSELFNHVPLFDGLPPDELRQYTDHAIGKHYTKKHVLYVRDDEAEWFYVIERGWVKLFRETLDGEEAIIDVLSNGQICGENAIFNDGRYVSSAEVVEDAVIYQLPVSLLKTHITSNNKLALNMLRSMSSFHSKQSRELEHMKIQNAPQRIGCFLLQLYKPSKAQPIRIHLPYDKLLIAARIGMQPETFSRALLKLQQETGIRIKGSTVEIDDITVLTDYSCSACSSTYPCQEC